MSIPWTIAMIDTEGELTPLESFQCYRDADRKLEFYWDRYPHAIIEVYRSLKAPTCSY